MLGFVVLVAGGALVDSLQRAYGWGDTTGTVAAVAALAGRRPAGDRRGDDAVPLGAAAAPARLLLAGRRRGSRARAVAALQPRRWRSTCSHSSSFGTVYGPLTGMFALLLWSQLTSLALFFGIAFAAQLEAVRAGVPSPVTARPRGGAERAQPADRRAAARSRRATDGAPEEARSRLGEACARMSALEHALESTRLFLHVLAATIWVGGQLTLAALVPALRPLGAEVTPRRRAGSSAGSPGPRSACSSSPASGTSPRSPPTSATSRAS